MKNLVISFGMSLVTSVIVYFGLSALSLHGEALVGLASVPFVAVHHVYEALDRRQTKQRVSKAPEKLPTLGRFALPWYLIACYGAVIVFGIVQVSGGIAGLLAALSGIQSQHVPPVAKFIATALVLVGSYFLGVWAGVRSRRLGFLSFLLGAFIGQVVCHTLESVIVSPSAYREFYGSDNTIALLPLKAIGGTVVFAPLGAIGFWRGRRRRLSRYLFYLLSLLSPESRAALVDLAYDEARVLSASPVAATRAT
jgi:hypothetical protein